MKAYGILIPALNPDEKLLDLIQELLESSVPVQALVVVDDGSDQQAQPIFQRLADMEDERIRILHHEVNRGKGAALKTGFKYILENFPQIQGIATMDADGQHPVDALAACIHQFEKHPQDLIIGARQFTNQIPWRSQFGNVLTRKLVRMLTRQNISDTQTGLRVIPRSYVRQLLSFPGERFEFEFDMLLRARKFQVKITEQPIPTIYLDGNKSSHFRVVRDSVAIYARFLKFAMSGLISFLVDVGLFELMIVLMGKELLGERIIVATIVSRLLSAMVNYTLNHRVVFGKQGRQTVIKYGGLFIIQMFASGYLTDLVTGWLQHSQGSIAPLIAKIVVDFTLFIISYQIQRDLIFKEKRGAD